MLANDRACLRADPAGTLKRYYRLRRDAIERVRARNIRKESTTTISSRLAATKERKCCIAKHLLVSYLQRVVSIESV